MAIVVCPECSERVSNLAVSCPKCGYSIGQHGTVEARQLINKPAKALLTTGICGLGLTLMGFFIWGFLYIGAAVTFAKYNLPSPTASNAEKQQFPWEDYWKARDQANRALLLMISHLVLATAFGVSGAAGWSMLRLRRYRLCLAGSIVVMPATLCLLIGIPIGIWSLTTLRKPEVRSAFS